MDVTGTIDTGDPAAVNREVRRVYEGLFGPALFSKVETTLEDVVRLFAGEYPGYQRCDTVYHDLEHTMQAYLAAARIFDGLVRAHKSGTWPEFMTLGLISALGHDTGFIKTIGDNHGHGGKYTLTHVERSKDFIDRYLPRLGFNATHIQTVKDIISCTGLNVNIYAIRFTSVTESEAGYVMGSADYLGQMSDPLYPEKLPRLYEEYRDGHVPGYDSADDLIKKTPAFFEEFVMRRLSEDFKGVYRFAASHFGGRDIYIEGIKGNIARLRDPELRESHP